MQTNNQKAFTLIELVFVIVILGVLAAIALPRFASTADTAYLSKAQSTLATVRSALATERQKRILRGDTTTNITDLSLDSNNSATTNAFDHFSADVDGNNAEVLRYPVKACSNNTQRACWAHTAGTTAYSYRFPDASEGVDGQADFVLASNRLDCTAADSADCLIVTQ